MGRRAAIALHLALFLVGTVLYVVFVLPRWWVLVGDIPSTLATAGRIVAGLPIAAAAVPVWMILQRSLRPSAATPELALRLRAWSAVLHVVAGAVILLAAITEIWLRLAVGGPWLFGVYGAGAAIAVLPVAAFALSFVAEKPPGPPKPAKAAKEKKPNREKRRDRKRTPEPAAADASDDTATATDDADDASDEVAGSEAAEISEVTEGVVTKTELDEVGAAEVEVAEAVVTEVETPEPGHPADEPADDSEPLPADSTDIVAATAEAPGLRNKRPAGKLRQRLRR
jgi:hypothetical protein